MKSVIYSEGRFADAKRLDGIPTEEQIELRARESDPQAFPDLKGDRAMNWAAAHSKLLHQHLKTKKLYSQFICIGPFQTILQFFCLQTLADLCTFASHGRLAVAGMQ